MTTLIKPELIKPVGSLQDLADYLAEGSRSPENWGIGTEMEKLVVDSATGEAAPYAKIEELLRRLEKTGQWQGVEEAGHLVALTGKNSSITLEPGGQLELSGQLCPDLHCSYGDFACHIEQIIGEAAALDLTFLGLGVQPFTPLEKIDWLPKARYEVMGPYMSRTGDRGQHMMKMTAGLQVNIDFADEADCFEKLRLGHILAPLLYALFANSPIMEDRPTGHLSTRGDIWSRTDPDRCGLIPQLFRPGAGFHSYVEFALDVPMYFIVRDGKFLNLTGQRFPFRRYLAEGFEGHHATLGDWDLHLSTLFPEVRLRPQIEFRSADSLPPDLSLGVSALIKGLFYDREAQREFGRLFENMDLDELADVYRQSWRTGLNTPFRKTTLRSVARRTFDISKRGLISQARKNARGMDETIFLAGIEEIIDRGQTLAERLLANWRGNRRKKLGLLRDHCGFGSPGL